MTAHTQYTIARSGQISEAMRRVAEQERLTPEAVRDGIAAGRLVICANPAHTNLRPMGVGAALTCKINANLGNSALTGCASGELAKVKAALAAGADMVMDLSTGEDSVRIRAAILAACPAPLGTVPIYEAVALIEDAMDLDEKHILQVIEQQVGVLA